MQDSHLITCHLLTTEDPWLGVPDRGGRSPHVALLSQPALRVALFSNHLLSCRRVLTRDASSAGLSESNCLSPAVWRSAQPEGILLFPFQSSLPTNARGPMWHSTVSLLSGGLSWAQRRVLP